jgi:hypothetical protein
MTSAKPSFGKHTLALSADQQTEISMILNDKSLDDTSKFMMLAEIQQRLVKEQRLPTIVQQARTQQEFFEPPKFVKETI